MMKYYFVHFVAPSFICAWQLFFGKKGTPVVIYFFITRKNGSAFSKQDLFSLIITFLFSSRPEIFGRCGFLVFHFLVSVFKNFPTVIYWVKYLQMQIRWKFEIDLYLSRLPFPPINPGDILLLKYESFQNGRVLTFLLPVFYYHDFIISVWGP